MIRRGFTVVELIITITIMGILLLLTVVNINNSQISARDDERAGDAAAIASSLESFYSVGNDTIAAGTYPGTDMSDSTNTVIRTTLRDIDLESLLSPGTSDPTKSLISATNAVQTTAGVLPQPTISQYVYQPLKSDGTLCTLTSLSCRKYNLYYRLEATNAVAMITSKHQ